MPIIVKAPTSDFKPAPEGLFQAVCVDVVDLGNVESEYKGEVKIQHKVRVAWQIMERDEETGKRYLVLARYTASLHEKAKLRKDLEAWRGRKFTTDELAGFDLEAVIGANCQLQIIHNVKDGTTYANIAAIVPLGKGAMKIDPEGYVRVKDRPKDHDQAHADDDESDRVPF